MKIASFFPLLLMMALSLSVQGRGDGSLYDVLGVSRDANQSEIRSAYKRMAYKWHPDKNKSPEAREKMMEINNAYKVLSNEYSRRRYDRTGEAHPTTSSWHRPTHNERHASYREGTITTLYFENVVLPESASRLWLLYFFGEFCEGCGEVFELWDELHEDMKSHGIGMGSVHISRHYGIASYCSVDMNSVPAIVAVVNRKVYRYHGPHEARSVINFANETLTFWTIIKALTAESFESFIADSITRNRPRLILFSPHTQPSLPYKAISFAKQHVADFAFVTMTDELSEESQAILKQYNVSQRSENFLVFKEYPRPSAILKGSEVTGDALRSVLEGLRLHLPRLTSQQVMEDTCGDGRICLILVVRGTQSYNDSITTAFRDNAVELSSTPQTHPPISLAYIDEEKQQPFLSSFQKSDESCENGQDTHDVLLLRRREGFNPSYAWFSGYCGSSKDFDKLLSFARRTSLKTASEQAPNLLDEFPPSRWEILWDNVAEILYRVCDSFTAHCGYYTETVRRYMPDFTLGAEGKQGRVGVEGKQGRVGAEGERGRVGAEGERGGVGAEGEQGGVGVEGKQGRVGAEGERGGVGAEGERGGVGAEGERGGVGAEGERGGVGAEGERGRVGAEGGRGRVGAEGGRGRVGAEGERGRVGAEGERGRVGAEGEQGRVGAEGEQGGP